MADVRVIFHHRELRALVRDRQVGRLLVEAAEPGIRQAQSQAPRRTGAGAGSIKAEAVLDGPEWTAHVSWDRAHFYMIFHELGTESLPARPFLAPSF